MNRTPDGLPELLPAEGWWEQVFHGRQPMEDLHVAVFGRIVDGRGTDIIGPFTLEGHLADDGRVSISKEYVGRHVVRYEGQHDGEGRMWGVWALPGHHGRWMITVGRDRAGADDRIGTIVPRGGP